MATQMKNEETSLIALTVERPDEALFKQSKKYLDYAKDYEIISPERALAAGDDLKEIKSLARQLEAKRTAITRPINKALKEINSLFKPAKFWLSQAEILTKGKLLAYQAEQDQIAAEAQRQADEAARKERVKLEKAADLAAQAGMDDRADELQEEAAVQEAHVIQSAAPKIEGVHTRVTWKAEVVDKMEFIKFIGENSHLHGLLLINQSALNAQARSLKDSLDLPGIKVVPEKSIAARS